MACSYRNVLKFLLIFFDFVKTGDVCEKNRGFDVENEQRTLNLNYFCRYETVSVSLSRMQNISIDRSFYQMLYEVLSFFSLLSKKCTPTYSPEYPF